MSELRKAYDRSYGHHPEVTFFEAAYLERFPGPPFSPLERGRAAHIIRQCASAKVKWMDVLTFYAAGFERSGHSIDWLFFNLREVLNKRVAPKPTSAFPGDDSKVRAEAFARMAAENTRRMNEAAQRVSSPEAAKKAIAEILAKLSR